MPRKLQYWAVRIGEYVEFRSGPKPIKVVSSLYRTRGKRRKLVLSQVVYLGGKVLGLVNAQDIYHILYVPLDGRIETTKAVKDRVLRRKK